MVKAATVHHQAHPVLVAALVAAAVAMAQEQAEQGQTQGQTTKAGTADLTDLMVEKQVTELHGLPVKARAQPLKPSGNPTAHCMLAAGAAGWLDTPATALPAMLAPVAQAEVAAAILAIRWQLTARLVQAAEAEAAAARKTHLIHAPHSRAVLAATVPC